MNILRRLVCFLFGHKWEKFSVLGFQERIVKKYHASPFNRKGGKKRVQYIKRRETITVHCCKRCGKIK